MNWKWMQWAAMSRWAVLRVAVFVPAVWLGGVALSAHASIQTSYTNSGISDYSPEFVSANDLVESDQPTVTNVTFSGTAMYGSSYAKMNDGYKLRGDLNVGNTGESLTPSDGSVLTFYLDGPHTIARIETFAAYDGGRHGQKYTLAVTTESNPSFTNVASIDFPRVTGALQLKVTIVNDVTTPIPDGVTSLRFTFSNSGGQESVYREIDINPGAPPALSFVTNAYSGTPTETVPEVASNDLVNAGQPSLTSVAFSGTALYGSSYTKINDGGKLGGQSYGVTAASLCPADGGVLTFDLNKAYTITNIQALSSHNSRNNHCYTLSAKAEGEANFTTVARLAFRTSVDGQYRVTIRNDGDPRLAKAMALRFAFRTISLDPVYREIDVFGVPFVPPGTVFSIR
jgi:hypothetical protein